MSNMAPAGWHPDPLARHQFRYWDGTGWTKDVNDRVIAFAPTRNARIWTARVLIGSTPMTAQYGGYLKPF